MRRAAIWVLGVGAVILLGWLALRPPGGEEKKPEVQPEKPGSAAPAVGWRYTDGKPWTPPEDAPKPLQARCAACHALPSPDILEAKAWRRVFEDMGPLMAKQLGSEAEIRELGRDMEELYAWYVAKAPAAFVTLPPDTSPPGLAFRAEALGLPARARGQVCNVNIVDLDRDGRNDVLVCDAEAGEVQWLRAKGAEWETRVLAAFPSPAKTAVVDADGDGDLDVAVAVLGSHMPTDQKIGAVAVLFNDGAHNFTPRVLVRDIARVSDVQPGDLDGDGDLDFSVAMFGWRAGGNVAWLRNDGAAGWSLQELYGKNGCIHLPVVDLNGDGRLDMVALIAQETEQIVAFLNEGAGTFTRRVLFDAGHPLFGLSGLQLVDLDRDGDVDMLFTNGDALDDPTGPPKPYHGVQWLEQTAPLTFAWRDLGRRYGPYRAVAADLDADGDLDIAVATLFNKWDDPDRQSLAWLENDGRQQFTPHALGNTPSHLVTVDAGDLDGDGDVDLVTGRMTAMQPIQPYGARVTLWKSGRK